MSRKAHWAAEAVVQTFIWWIIGYGWYYMTFHVGIGWLILRHKMWLWGCLYLTGINAFAATAAAVYFILCSGRTTHGIPQFPLPDLAILTEPYECVNSQGVLAVCHKGDCQGAWKPPRAHHCSTCGVCRVGFDHHCPWLGNCVTSGRMKLFLSFLILTPTAVTFAMIPFARTLWDHVTVALEVSRNDTWARVNWWDWYGSWIFFGGPFGRWIWGIVLGFRILKAQGGRDYTLPGEFVERPHLRLLALAFPAVLLSIFALGMFAATLKEILTGITPVEALQPRNTPERQGFLKQTSKYICIPHLAGTENGPKRNTYEVLKGERIYDLGVKNNWRSLVEAPLLPKESQVYTWPKINPFVLQRLRKSATNI